MLFVALALLLLAPLRAAPPDRAVAEWVLRCGGSVVLEGSDARIWDLAALPAGDLRLRTVNLVSVVLEPSEFQRLSGLSHLKELYVSGRTWHSMPAKVSAETLRYFGSLTSLEKFILSLPVQTEIPLQDDAIAGLAPLVRLRELR